jgi:hypothetical protein
VPNTPRRELTPPQQRRQIRRQEEQKEWDRINEAVKRHLDKQDQALKRWANPEK